MGAYEIRRCDKQVDSENVRIQVRVTMMVIILMDFDNFWQQGNIVYILLVQDIFL
jgi:hypothetical protein